MDKYPPNSKPFLSTNVRENILKMLADAYPAGINFNLFGCYYWERFGEWIDLKSSPFEELIYPSGDCISIKYDEEMKNYGIFLKEDPRKVSPPDASTEWVDREKTCLKILSRFPNGIAYSRFQKLFEQDTSKTWSEWPDLCRILSSEMVKDPESGELNMYLFPRKQTPSVSYPWFPYVPKENKQKSIVQDSLLSEFEKLDNDPPETSNVFVARPFAYIDGIEMTPLKYDLPTQSLDELDNDDNRNCFQVTVSQYYTPVDFYIQFKDFAKKLDLLMRHMRSFYATHMSSALTISPELIDCDVICAAPFSDLGYHRAKVIKFHEQSKHMVEIYYIDYGTVEHVAIEHLKYLPKEYAQLPAQAIHAQLPSLSPVNFWDEHVQRKFMSLTAQNRAVWAWIIKKQEHFVVELTYVTSEDDLHISEALVQAGLAVRLENDEQEQDAVTENDNDEPISNSTPLIDLNSSPTWSEIEEWVDESELNIGQTVTDESHLPVTEILKYRST